MPIGSRRFCRWTLLAGMTMRPRATSSRISSGSRSSRSATKSHRVGDDALGGPIPSGSSAVAPQRSGIESRRSRDRGRAQTRAAVRTTLSFAGITRIRSQGSALRPRAPPWTPLAISTYRIVSPADETASRHDRRRKVRPGKRTVSTTPSGRVSNTTKSSFRANVSKRQDAVSAASRLLPLQPQRPAVETRMRSVP